MTKITAEFAMSFADHWIASWNAHDLQNLLQYYEEDVCIESRIANLVVPESKGIIKGKEALHNYWATGLARNKELRFEMLDVLYGINGLTIYYVNITNNLRAAETLIFNSQHKIQRVIVHHSE